MEYLSQNGNERGRPPCSSDTALPKELIDKIIDYSLAKGDDMTLLLQLYQISKAWRAAAASRLYAFVDLSCITDDPSSMDRVSSLCWTFRRSPELSTYVKRLWIRLTGGVRLDYACFQLLRLCPTTPHLILKGKAPHDLSSLTDALARTNFQTMHFGLLKERADRSIPSVTTLVRILLTCSRIEKVTYDYDKYDAYEIGSEPEFFTLFLRRPFSLPLVKLDLSSAWLVNMDSIRVIGSLELPHLKIFRFSYVRDSSLDTALTQCLEKWAQHLEELCLSRRRGDHRDFRIKGTTLGFIETLKRLTSLRSLEISGCTTSSGPSYTRRSIFRVSLPDDDDDEVLSNSGIGLLASLLEEKSGDSQSQAPSYLPALTILEINSSIFLWESLPAERDHLIGICKSRGIALTIPDEYRISYNWNSDD